MLHLIRSAKEINECAQSGPHLAAAWVIKIKARKRLAPIFEHSDQTPILQRIANVVFEQIGKTGAVENGIKNQPVIIEDEWAVDGNFQLLTRFFKLPAIDTPTGKR